MELIENTAIKTQIEVVVEVRVELGNTMKIMIFESQYHFANISTMEALIFMKFETL